MLELSDARQRHRHGLTFADRPDEGEHDLAQGLQFARDGHVEGGRAVRARGPRRDPLEVHVDTALAVDELRWKYRQRPIDVEAQVEVALRRRSDALPEEERVVEDHQIACLKSLPVRPAPKRRRLHEVADVGGDGVNDEVSV